MVNVLCYSALEFCPGLAPTLAVVFGIVAVVIVVLVALGREPRGTRMGADTGGSASVGSA
jgi:hypothetical protein